MSVQIYVGNMNYRMSEDSLKSVFEEFGSVNSAKIIMDRETGRSKGFGFIEMESQEEAENAITQLNDAEVEGRRLRVNFARPKNY